MTTAATPSPITETTEPETISDRFFVGAFATLAVGIVMSLGIFGVVAYHDSLANTTTTVVSTP